MKVNLKNLHPLLLKSRGTKPRKGAVVQCLFCGVDVYRPPSRVKRTKNFFCSREHSIAYDKANSFSFFCIVCGKEKFTQPFQFKIRANPTCSMKCRGINQRRVAEKRRVENGYTKHQLDRLARYSPENERWRKEVFSRDNYTCQICNQYGGYLEADHIQPWAYFPELRFVLSNGRTLCRECHDKTKISSYKMRKIYKDKVKELNA